MIENTELNVSTVSGGIIDFLKSLISSLIGIGILFLIVGCLIAPVFESYIEDRMLRRSEDGTYLPLDQMAAISSRMIYVKLILWGICLLSWAFVVYVNL